VLALVVLLASIGARIKSRRFCLSQGFFREEVVRNLLATLTVATAIATFTLPASAELGSDVPSDAQLVAQRDQEVGGLAGPGIFEEIAVPPDGTVLRPVKRVPREKFGLVGPFPLQLQDLRALVFPNATHQERKALLEGLTFFTTQHTAAEGLGPMNNQEFCLGCHLNAAEGVRSPGLLSPKSCIPGSTCVSVATRAARSTPTNFEVTSFDPASGGGLPPDNLDAINNTGRTAAFTTFGDFTLSLTDAAAGSIGFFDPLDGAAHRLMDGSSPISQAFGGFVQHVRPADLEACVPKPIPPVEFDANLTGPNPVGFRRAVGERAGPPYIGRGLIEAVPTDDIVANADPDDVKGHASSLGNFAASLGCTTDCISGRPNMIPRTVAVNAVNGNLTGFVGGVGRFGLRANGVEVLQFVVGGMQGELSLTSLINPVESNFPTLFPSTGPEPEPQACRNAASPQNSPEVHLSTVFSTRNLIRDTAPPEFGDALLDLLESPNPAKRQHAESVEGKVQRGAELFGIDLVAFANRTVRGGMTAIGDGRDVNAINQADRKLNCVGCHTPIRRTGQSPADMGAEHLSFVWAPIFSDLLLHKMPVIDPERVAQRPRDVVVIPRLSTKVSRRGEGEDENRGDDFTGDKHRVFDTFDLLRNLADDTFNGQKAVVDGREFRTAPLMGLGRIGPPFLHDARVFLSALTVDRTPAGTVTTNRRLTNAPLVVRNPDEALLAAIELHDLPAPDDENTPRVPGAGCPVPPEATNVSYGPSPQDVICPAYDSATSQTNRSDAREVIRRFRGLSSEDQQAVIEFLKQL
jgi:CxxC motif-containing protein (DUF1111 family)